MTTDALIIGGGPAGVITALTAKSVYPEKTVCVVKEIGDGVIPCAIPYMINTLADPAQNKMGDLPLDNAGIDIVVGKAVALDTASRTVTLESGDTLNYEKVVLATGTTSILPPIDGIDKTGVFAITKSMSSMIDFREAAQKAKHIVIIGGGFIGAEFTDEFTKDGDVQVHLVEMMPKLLYSAFDDEFCDQVEDRLRIAGVTIHAGRKVVSIDGDGQVSSVTLDTGDRIPADMVLVSTGARPNTDLARQAGLHVTDRGAIWVDDYMRTETDNVFAVGDCALKRDFFTKKAAPVWLASTATAEARIAGTNLFGIRVIRQIQGTIAAFSTRIGQTAFASAGLTERGCRAEGFRFVSATTTAPDRHPGNLPGSTPLAIKLIFADRSGVLLGGQISGGDSVGELINVVALGIQKRVNVREIDMMQIATHPLLTPAPTVHPFINAAHQALAQMRAAYQK